MVDCSVKSSKACANEIKELYLLRCEPGGKLVEEEEDELMSLPGEVPAGGPELGCLKHPKHVGHHKSPSEEKTPVSDSIRTPGKTAPIGVRHMESSPPLKRKGFNRLDPNRRSLSSPAVDLLTGGHPITVASCELVGQSGGGKLVSSPVDVESKSKIGVRPVSRLRARRRTALGLISLGSSHFRLGGRGEHQQLALAPPPPPTTATTTTIGPSGHTTSSWRHWFGVGRANSTPASSSSQSSATGRKLMQQSSNSCNRRMPQENSTAEDKVQEEPEHQASSTSATVPPQPQPRQESSTPPSHQQLQPPPQQQQSTTKEPSVNSQRNDSASRLEEEQGQEEPVYTCNDTAAVRRNLAEPPPEVAMVENLSLVDKFIDCPEPWRQIMRQANSDRGWSLGQLSESEIKRQEVVHELVQTERHHCLTLALMRQVYLAGIRQLNELRSTRGDHGAGKSGSLMSSVSLQSLVVGYQHESWSQMSGDLIDLDRLFPALEELIQAHELFFAHLRLKLVDSCQQPHPAPVGLVGPLGDLLSDQFRIAAVQECAGRTRSLKEIQPAPLDESTTTTAKIGAMSVSSTCRQQVAGPANGQRLLRAYSKFCGQHADSSRYYKQLMQTDKGFKQFIEHCNKQNPSCRQRGIPECNLLVTQRLTKYPLLIEQLIKTSKDDCEEQEKLKEALAHCKLLLAELNNHLARKESFERLLDIYAQFCPKSYTTYNRFTKFTKHDLLQHKRLRRLLHSDSQIRLWSATRRKLFQVLCLILNDIVVFLRIESAPSNSSSTNSGVVAAAISSHGSLYQLHQAAAQEEAASSSFVEPHNFLQSTSNLSQCALLNAVAGALQQAHNNSQHHHKSSGSDPLSERPTASVRYYFANIDNKSSVISLSKLLVREKAAAASEPEPRIYLISSSPSQPEMYELAFVSKRHQSSFVEKLKACVEQHRQSLEFQEEEEEEEEEEEAEEEEENVRIDCGLCASTSDVTHAGDIDVGLDEAEEFNNSSSFGEDEDANSDISDYRMRSKTDAEPSDEVSKRLEPFELDIEQEAVLQRPACSTQSSDESNQPMSAESGLSERARDSMDEVAPIRQKLRGGRRRRAQRSRNISNQSSSSSEATHRQAMQLAAANQQMNSANSTGDVKQAMNQLDCRQQEMNCKSSERLVFESEEFDSGRGHDSSSSSSSSSCEANNNSLGSPSTLEVVCASLSLTDATRAHQEGPLSAGGAQSSASNEPTTSPQISLLRGKQDSSRASSDASGSTMASSTKIKSNLVKCSSILSKPTCSFIKHRKLSSVSTMSNQLKLISKFKSSNSDLEYQRRHHHHHLHHQLYSQHDNHYHHSPVRHQHHPAPFQQMGGCGGGHFCCSQQQLGASQNEQRQLIGRRASFVPEQKLEELRDLRIQLDKDKQEWQAKFDRMQEQLLNERRELDLARDKLKQDRQQVANEREQLYRKLDVLREKGILLSPSHKVIITTPDLRVYSQHQQHPLQHQLPAANDQCNNSSSYGSFRQPVHQVNYPDYSSSIHIQSLKSAMAGPTNETTSGSTTASTCDTGNYNKRLNDQHFIAPQRLASGLSNLFVRNPRTQQSHYNENTPQSLPSLSLTKVPLIGSPSKGLLVERFGAPNMSGKTNVL